MGMRILVLSVCCVGLGLLASGCKSVPPPAQAVQAAPPAPEPPKEIPPHRRPSLAGDVLVYPVQWRNAEELGFRLYHILYPKYGPNLQIVPDPTTNTLLIYLGPRGDGMDQDGMD